MMQTWAGNQKDQLSSPPTIQSPSIYLEDGVLESQSWHDKVAYSGLGAEKNRQITGRIVETMGL